MTGTDETGWLEKTTIFLEKNYIGVKLGIYGVALCGLGIAIRSVQPFTKFTSSKRIPKSFIDGRLKLTGEVLRIEFFPKTLLAVDHEPLLGGRFRKPAGLPVHIEGINITGNGLSWLQSIVVGSKVDFVLLEKNPDYVSCIIYQKNKNIGNQLVSLGFASVAPFNSGLEECEQYKYYYKKLLKSEDIAEKRRTGVWWDTPERFRLLHRILDKIAVLNPKTALVKA